MPDGFLGYHASFMLDVVVCALVLIVPALAVSISLVKVRRAYTPHRNLQLVLAGILLAAVLAFEIDIRLHGGWEPIVERRTPPLNAEQMDFVRKLLAVHLLFAITTPLLWATTIWLAVRRMPAPPGPSPHSRLHQRLGWLSAADLTLTAITGLLFYYYAFIA